MAITPLAFNGKARVNIGFDSDTEARKYSKTITITKVNGVPNTHPQKSASGSLITVTSSLASLPVVEEFTGTWCGYCPYGTVGMKKVHDKYGDKVALIAVHNGDVMAISAYSPVVGRYASGYPSSSINREGGNIYPYYLVNYIDRAFSRATVGAIELTASWTDEQQTSIKFDTNTKFIYNDNSGSYGIAFVLVEDGLKGEGYQWNQSNFLSGGSGDSDMSFWYNAGSSVSGLEYDHVAVAGWDVLDGISGSVKTSIKADEVQKFSYTGDLATFSLIQDKTKLTAIALLINRENGTIVNASQVKIGNGTPDNPLKGDVNGDNSVNVADIASIIDIMSGVGAAPVSARSADVNGDGEVNVADIGAVIDIMAGKGGDAEPDEKAYTTCPDGNHPHMIDLGLPTGTKWACCNVGADTPEGYGNYYAWGETSPKSVYNWDTYRYGYYNDDGDYSHLVNIGSDIAGTDYDAATANWGTPWRMPSLAQIRELLDNTISTWTTQNGVNGRKFTGSNGGSVFLPAAGYRWDDELGYAGSGGSYWSSSLNESRPGRAYRLYFGSGNANWHDGYRSDGRSVRPVR